MNRKKNQKVFKHVLCNPFVSAWPDISNEETQQIVNSLNREAVSQALNELKIENKKLKTSETNLETFFNNNLIIGINEIIKHIDKVSFVILFKCDANEVLLEPLMLLCRNKGIKCLSGSFQVAYEKLREITGVKKLAALALPIMHAFPLTEIFLNSLTPKPQKKLLGIVIKSTEILKKKLNNK